MSAITATPATIKRATGSPRVVPTGTPVAVAAAATLAAERLSDAIKSAAAAGARVYVDLYGADIDPAAVKLAKSAAVELSGGTKSRGGARANVLAVLSSITSFPEDELTDRVFVAAARARLDELAADKRARTERKKALAEKVNDHAASLTERAAALEVLAGMDSADSAVKSAAVIERLNAAIMAARVDGMAEVDMLELVAAAYAVKLDK